MGKGFGPEVFLGLFERFGASSRSDLARRITTRPVITIGGDQCTGKSTLASNLARRFGGTSVSAGDMFRQVASQRGVSPSALSREARLDPRVDVEIDYHVCARIAEGPEQSSPVLVVEGRQPALMALALETVLGRQNLTRIYLQCTPREQALRFVAREHPADVDAVLSALPDRPYRDLAEVVAELRGHKVAPMCADELADTAARDQVDLARFQDLYCFPSGVSFRSPEVYHHVVDTTSNRSRDTLAQVLRLLEDHARRPA